MYCLEIPFIPLLTWDGHFNVNIYVLKSKEKYNLAFPVL